MRIPTFQSIRKWVEIVFNRQPDGFLRKSLGVIHVGANAGQERDIYKRNKVRVVWVEPIPEVFEKLLKNIRNYPNQIAFQHLVTDQDDVEYTFHISNNEGASSSILELNLHKDIWPEVAYERTIKLRSITLSTLLKREKINVHEYDALIMDTQGSELLVLKGAAPILHSFRFIKIEVADFESYADCCKLEDINEFLTQHRFREISRHKFAERAEGGNYYDMIYERTML